ncbi:MAG: site-specific integrase [Bacteroidetes bacterium]|nr:site-specific integrase [Bacteroidota bacterium]
MGKKVKVKQVVRLREKQLTNGYIRLYLDIYYNGNRWTEFLKDLKYKKNLQTPEDRHEKAEILALAEHVRATRESIIVHSNYGQVSPKLRSKDFIQYFKTYLDDYSNKDIRIVKYCLHHFKIFIGTDRLSFGALNEKLFRDFKKYLEDNLNGETPYNYFTKLKTVVKQAFKDRYLPNNPIESIKNTRNEGIKKDILNFNELGAMVSVECRNKEVRNAYLFCFNTGLRYCDVENLIWEDIQNERIILKEQKKTKKPVYIHLNSNAKKCLGEEKAKISKVFNLPSFTSCLIILKEWTKKAGIQKNITWHSARHSYATHLVSQGIPINIVSGLLGHSGIKHTQKYIRYIDELGKEAVNSIPELNI